MRPARRTLREAHHVRAMHQSPASQDECPEPAPADEAGDCLATSLTKPGGLGL